MASLDGQAALVTGGSRRIGRVICRVLAERGAGVVIHYRSSFEEAESLAGDIRSGGGRAWTVGADLEDPVETAELVARATDLAGPLDILVNNASIFPPGTLQELRLEDLVQNLHVNAWAPFVLSRAFAQQNRKGNIVNLLDNKVVVGDPEHAAYHLSKRTLFTLTRMMAMEFAPGVRVNAVAPGLILPPPGEDESYLRRVASANPLQRWGSPGQVARAVLFLVTTDFVTGQVIYVDGGQHMKGAFYA